MLVENIICISIDGLRASALGAYGNTWHPTPALDTLASESIVYDWMFCEQPTLEGFFRAVWREDVDSLPRRLSDAGVQTALTTDDRTVAEYGERSGFSEARQLEFTSAESAATVADAELAQLFAVAIDQLSGWPSERGAAGELKPRRLLWLHARGFYGAWDAPLGLRESLLEEDDPPAIAFVAPPAVVGMLDHDELLLYRAAYAGLTIVLDECIGALDAALSEFGLKQNTLVLLTAPRGFALGEHGAIGDAATALFSERVHVPCLLRLPGAVSPPPRRMQLVQTRDLHSTLLNAAGAIPSTSSSGESIDLLSSEVGLGRPLVICSNDQGEAVIRTPAWLLRRPAQMAGSDAQAAEPIGELYLKPDDRWEANEIASRAPDVASRLLAALDSSLQAGHSLATSVSLDEDLLGHSR